MEQGWAPFRLGKKPEYVRPLESREGVADRLRLVAFAELQARDLFRFGAEKFRDSAPREWLSQWTEFSEVEERHAQMLLDRMGVLGVRIEDRMVSDKLSRLCLRAEDPLTFLFLLSSAEERGMEAGFTLGEQMNAYDSASAAVFKQIADEEVAHVAMAKSVLRSQDIDLLRTHARALSASL